MNLFNDHLNLSNNIYDNAKILKSVELNKQQELVNRNPTTKYYQTLALNLQDQVKNLTQNLNEAKSINHIELQLQEGFFDDMRRGTGNMVTRLGRRLAGGAPVDDVVDPQIAIDANNKQNARSTHIGRTINSLRPLFAFTKDRIPMAIAHHKAKSESPLQYDTSEVPDTGMPTNKKEFKQAYKTNDSYNKSQAAQVVARGHNAILGHFASMIQRASQSASQHPDNKPDVVIDPVHTGHGYDVEDVAINTMSDPANGRGSVLHPDHEAYHRWQSRPQNEKYPSVQSFFGPNSGTYHVGEDFEHLLPAGGGKTGIRAVNAANRERYRARMQDIKTLMNPQDIPDQWRVAGRMG